MRRRTTVLAGLVLAGAAALAAAAVATVELPAVQTFAVGDYQGSNVAELRVIAEANGWVLDEDQVRTDDAAAGTVVSQQPAPATQLGAGSLLAVEVASGPVLRVVPNLVGLTGFDAQVALAGERLRAATTVVGQPLEPPTIAASRPFDRDSGVNLLDENAVAGSDGSRDSPPASGFTGTGSHLGDAVIGGNAVDFNQAPPDAWQGVVVSQQPPAGTEVLPDTAVEVVVSLGS